MHNAPMDEQTSIPKHKLTRAASLGKAGVKIGANYLRYYGRKALTGDDSRETLHRDNAEDSYEAFSKLKGGPLKVAQMLSIDKNLLPAAYSEEFSKAQYSAPPLSYPLVARTFRRELGQNPDEIFDSFTRSAVSGASIGQVHRASKDGKQYAVKVQYPGVADSLQSDLRLVKPLAMKMFNLDSKSLEPYLKEVEARLIEETDYCLELKRAQSLIEQSSHLPNTRFPQYHPEYSSAKIITMDWMQGETLDKFADSEVSQERRNIIGQALWDFYHHQVHALRVFHADPHPGNFLVEGDDLIVLDFGCVKALEDDFYKKFFALLSRSCFTDEAVLLDKLIELELVLPEDGPRERALLLDVYQESIELLARPFHTETFDFGDEAYMRAIYEFGEKSSSNKELQKINNARGSAHALYVNRAYFGLYNLMARLKARVVTELPAVVAL